MKKWPGLSLRSILKGTATKLREGVFIQNDDPYLGLRMRTVVTDRFKLTCYPQQPFGELFDLQNDSRELRNLWSNPQYKNTRTELIRLLFEEEVKAVPWHPLPYADS